MMGYSISVPNADVAMVTLALKNKMETQYALKASRFKGYTAYNNQPFQPFGASNYDIFTNVEETGKRGSKTTFIKMIVCSGNMNYITDQSDAETAGKIKDFLTEFVPYVQEFAMKQQENAMKARLAKLNSEKAGLQKDKTKLSKQIEKLNGNLGKVNKELEENDAAIRETQDKLQKMQSTMP